MYVSSKRVASFHPVARMLLVGAGAYLLILGPVAYAIWPALHTSVHAFGRTGEVARIARALFLPALFTVELALVGWAESSLRQLTVLRTRSAFSDFSFLLFWHLPGQQVVIAVMSLGLVLLPAWLHLHAALARATGWSFDISGGPVALQVGVFLFALSFFDYWQHRLDHMPWFWPLHRYHHSAEDFCILTSIRVHPARPTGLLLSMPAILIGISGEAIFWSGTIVVMFRYLIHSKINSDFGWVGRWLIQSPLHHRRHHQLTMSGPGTNYSLVPLWDRLFGTWGAPADQTLAIGVSRRYRHGLWVAPDILRDYVDFWRALAGRYRDDPGGQLEAGKKALRGDPDGVGVGAAEALSGDAAEGERARAVGG